MDAIAHRKYETLNAANSPAGRPQQRLARLTGLLYLALAIAGGFSNMVIESLRVAGDAAATAGKVLGSFGLFEASMAGWVLVVALDAAIAVALYVLLKQVNRGLSVATAASRFVYTTALAVVVANLFTAHSALAKVDAGTGDAIQLSATALTALERFGDGFLIALVFFGLHLILLGVLLHRSGYVPKAFGILLVIGGIGYIADTIGTFFVPGHGGLITAILIAPSFVGEIGLTLWLLVKGVRIPEPHLER
jgi:hypothetical protein